MAAVRRASVKEREGVGRRKKWASILGNSMSLKRRAWFLHKYWHHLLSPQRHQRLLSFSSSSVNVFGALMSSRENRKQGEVPLSSWESDWSGLYGRKMSVQTTAKTSSWEPNYIRPTQEYFHFHTISFKGGNALIIKNVNKHFSYGHSEFSDFQSY